MKLRQFQKILAASAAIPVTRDDGFVARVTADMTVAVIPSRTPFLRRIALSFAAAAFSFALFVTGFLGFHADVTVTVDVNPSFELRINHYDRVVGLEALNGEAEAILAGIGFFNARPETVLSELYEALSAAGYVTDQDVILLGISGIGEAEGERYETSYSTALGQATVLYMNAFETTLTLRTSAAFAESVFETDDARSAVWEDVFATDAAPASGSSTTIEAVTTTAGTDTFYDVTDKEAVYNLSPALDGIEIAVLAESLGVTEAKLRLAIAVFNGDESYATMSDLVWLTVQPVSALATLYANLPQ